MKVKDLSKEDQEKALLRYSQLVFANLKKNIIQDLVNSRNESVIYKKYPKDRIVTMMENPQRNEKGIRELSGFLYLVSSHYRRLVDYYATILIYNYTIVPTNFPHKKPTNKAKYKETYYNIIHECEKYNLRHEATKAIKIAVRDGIYYGLCYETSDSFYIKPFDNSYAKISSIEDGTFVFSINLNYFSDKEDLLPMYGTEFESAWLSYKGDKVKKIKGNRKKQWFEPSNGICIKADESDPIYSLPLFTGLLLSVFDIEDYKLLHKAKAENDNYKALSAKMETDDDGVPIMDFDVATKYYNQMAANLPDGIGLLLSPFEVKDFSFSNSAVSEKNDVITAEEDFWFSSGTSPLIFGSSKATSSASLTLSVKPDEEISFLLLQQFERYFNKKIKKMDLPFGFKIKFSDQSIFNTTEHINRLSKAAQYGMPVKLQYASALGLSPSDVVGMSYLEDDILSLANKTWKTPLISSNTQNSSDGEAGRSAVEAGETITESNEKTREGDSNTNR